MKNQIYYGDCLDVMQGLVQRGIKVDLIYLDPPFNSQAKYNVLFGKSEDKAQVEAFQDTWTWTEDSQDTKNILLGLPDTSDFVKGLDTIICLLYTSPSPRDRQKSRMPSSA